MGNRKYINGIKFNASELGVYFSLLDRVLSQIQILFYQYLLISSYRDSYRLAGLNF